MQRTIYFLFFCLLSSFSHGQIVDQIRDASDANTEAQIDSDSDCYGCDDESYDYDYDGGGGGGSSCNGCAVLTEGILNILFSREEEEASEEGYYVAPEDPFDAGRMAYSDSLPVEEMVLEEVQPEQVQKKRGWGWYGELELRSAFGSEYLMALPEARVGYWIFSTNFRYYGLVEPGVNFISSYRTIDWQVLQLQAITSRNFNLRFGLGLLNERYSGNTFPEFGMEAKVVLFKGRLGTPTDVRYAWDPQTENPVRGEFGIGAEYRLMEFFHADLHASAGYMYQQYYGSIDLNAFQVGLRFVFY